MHEDDLDPAATVAAPPELLRPDKPLAPGLYLVATPIGNLEDITLRALRILRQADRIACEDTRQTQKLLNHFSIATKTVSYHLFNETTRTVELIDDLKCGARVAVVSDAGMPGIADPGAHIAAAAIAAGIPVFPVPGANAALSALIASGLPAETFTFHGFLPSKSGQRKSYLEALHRPRTHVFYESPHRILESLADVEATFGKAQHVVVARELTKLHEEFLRGSARDVHQTLASRNQVRGEMVMLFALAEAAREEPTTSVRAAVEALVAAEGLSEKDALKRVAKERGIGKSDAYRELQREQKRR